MNAELEGIVEQVAAEVKRLGPDASRDFIAAFLQAFLQGMTERVRGITQERDLANARIAELEAEVAHLKRLRDAAWFERDLEDEKRQERGR